MPRLKCYFGPGSSKRLAGQVTTLKVSPAEFALASLAETLFMRDTNLSLRARRLRRNATDAERYLWARIRARQLLGFKFYRQFPIGPFIVDFCCRSARLVVELDGEQHSEQRDADLQRSDFLGKQGYRVIRFWNHEVLREIQRVVETILQALEKDTKTSGETAQRRSPVGSDDP